MLLPSPTALIPGVGSLVAQINLFLDTLEKRLDDSSSKYKKYIEALDAEIKRYGQLAKSFLTTIQQIIDLLTFPPDIYIGSFPFLGKGGNQFFIEILGKALTDVSDPNRPPFDEGSEVVTGFVIYAGSATAGKLTALKNVLEFWFSGAHAEAESAYTAAVTSINAAVTSVQSEIDLLGNLERAPTEAANTTVPMLPAIGPDLEPATEQNDGTECTT
jgi:hypothetical protein